MACHDGSKARPQLLNQAVPGDLRSGELREEFERRRITYFPGNYQDAAQKVGADGHQPGHHDQDHEQQVFENRQQRAQPRPAARFSAAAMARMRSTVLGAIAGWLRNARDTVVCETPAMRAMSLIVTGLGAIHFPVDAHVCRTIIADFSARVNHES